MRWIQWLAPNVGFPDVLNFMELQQIFRSCYIMYPLGIFKASDTLDYGWLGDKGISKDIRHLVELL